MSQRQKAATPSKVSEVSQIDEDGDEVLPPPTNYEKDNFLQKGNLKKEAEKSGEGKSKPKERKA